MIEVRIDGVTKRFGGFTAVDDIRMTFPENAVTCLLGPSGCGKTTLMRMIAGLERPTEGRILFGERDVTRLPPRKRNVGMVFQYPVMYPTLTVAQNIRLPLDNDRSLSEAERRQRLEEVLDVLQMADRVDATISDLDAGSRQKVAVGRSVARHAPVVLFDEPTTNVEVNAKLQLIRAFKEVTQRLRQTIVYVTHDQTEAMTLADNIALMKDGRIVQNAPPRDLYAQPNSRFGGWFLGNPGMNFIPLTADAAGRPAAPLLPHPLAAEAVPDLVAGIRPEAMALYPEPRPDAVAVEVIGKAITIAGQVLVRVRAGGQEAKVKVPRSVGRALGTTAWLHVAPDEVALFRGEERIDARVAWAARQTETQEA